LITNNNLGLVKHLIFISNVGTT